MPILSWAALTLLLLAAPAAAMEIHLAPPGTGDWRQLEFPRISRHTRYEVLAGAGVSGVRAVSDCAASGLYLPVDRIDLESTPRLHWRWKIEKGLQIADEHVKSGDDFAARVYVMFCFEPEHASLWDRARHAVGTTLWGRSLPGHAINYVWSSHQAAGAAWENPFTQASKMVALGSGPLPDWTDAVVDVAADHVRFFGRPAPALLAVALMTDSDNSCQSAIAAFAEFRFTGP